MAQGTRLNKSFTAEMAIAMRDIVREKITSALDNKLEPVHKYLEELKTQLADCNKKVSDLEKVAVETDIRLSELERDQCDLTEEFKYLRQKMDRLENHSRKMNIRILGLPEGIEAGNPTAFTAKLLYDLFGEEVMGPPPLISIAHRTGPAKSDPRCMIAKLYSFEVRRKITRLAAASRSLTHDGRKISIYPDLSAEILQHRATFNQVRLELRKRNLRFGFIHPATLIVTFRDATHKFSTAKDAQEFVDNHIKRGDNDGEAPSTSG